MLVYNDETLRRNGFGGGRWPSSAFSAEGRRFFSTPVSRSIEAIPVVVAWAKWGVGVCGGSASKPWIERSFQSSFFLTERNQSMCCE